jgi:hypothetical protein
MTRFIRVLVLYVLVGINVAGLALAQTQGALEGEETQGALEGGGTPKASAQAEAAPEAIVSGNHVLKKTYFQTVNDAFINLSTTWVDAFANTLVNCPSPGPCAIAVTVSSQFGQIDPQQVAQVRVFVNGVLTPPGDSCCLNISRNAGNLPQTNTMTFVARGVPFGNRLVQVQFAISGGTTGYADYRTLEIRVFKP